MDETYPPPNAGPADRSIATDVLLQEEPDDEEDGKEQQDGDEEGNEEDEGYSE